MDIKVVRDEGIELDLSGVKVDKAEKVERLELWRRGVLGGNAEPDFERWLVGAIAKGRVVIVGPKLGKRILNFVTSAKRHVAAGRPKSSPELVAARLDVCGGTPGVAACDLFDRKRSRCKHRKCGCNLRKKAGWRDQSCPLKLWPGDLAPAVKPENKAIPGGSAG